MARTLKARNSDESKSFEDTKLQSLVNKVSKLNKDMEDLVSRTDDISTRIFGYGNKEAVDSGDDIRAVSSGTVNAMGDKLNDLDDQIANLREIISRLEEL